MKANIKLTDSKAYRWVEKENIFFRGFFYYDSKFYTDDIACEFVLNNRHNMMDIIKDLNGSFSIIIDEDDDVILFADKIRSFPLFYKRDFSDFKISDNIFKIYSYGDEIDSNSLQEFKCSKLFVTGSNTLAKDIYSVQASEYVVLNKKNLIVEKTSYFKLKYQDYYDDKKAKNEFWKVYDNVGKCMVEALDDRTAVIPLSGGYDSRMIVDMLKRQGYEKVVCFSYGKENSKESRISKKVADDRSYKWIFVKYTKKKYIDMIKSGEYLEFEKYAGNLVSLPHIQDLVAVKELHDKELIPPDSVFIPGHSGDFNAGSHITEDFMHGYMTLEEFRKWFMKKFFPECRDQNNIIIENKTKCLKELNSEQIDSEVLLSFADTFNMRERQAKYIVNSIRTYEFFGYEWLVPLWSNDIINYWTKISINNRYQRKLYIECVDKRNIKSTHDNSMYKKIASVIYKNKYFTKCSRISKRIYEYFFHPFSYYKIFGFHKYLKCLFNSKENFDVRLLVNNKYLEDLGIK